MTSFARLQLRVADRTQPPYRRLSCLRSCLEHLAPYGLRSTYMYLTVAAGIPRDLNADPTSLVRAVDELGAARVRWLSGVEPVIQRRREQKAAGIRTPTAQSWSGHFGHVLRFREDPRRRPEMTLKDYVERRLRRLDGVRLSGCADCGADVVRLTATGHGFLERCAQCDVVLKFCACGSAHSELGRRYDRWWPEIWRREHMDGAGRPDPAWPGWDLGI